MIQSKISKSQSLFETLVTRGEKIEADAKSRIDKTQSKLKENTENFQKKREEVLSNSKNAIQNSIKLDNIKERVTNLRSKISENMTASETNLKDCIAQASEKIDEITGKANSITNS